MGLQSLIFYTNGAWLPDILQARAGATDASAGALLALTMGMGIPISFLTAALAARVDDQRPLAVVAALFPAAGVARAAARARRGGRCGRCCWGSAPASASRS